MRMNGCQKKINRKAYLTACVNILLLFLYAKIFRIAFEDIPLRSVSYFGERPKPVLWFNMILDKTYKPA